MSGVKGKKAYISEDELVNKTLNLISDPFSLACHVALTIALVTTYQPALCGHIESKNRANNLVALSLQIGAHPYIPVGPLNFANHYVYIGIYTCSTPIVIGENTSDRTSILNTTADKRPRTGNRISSWYLADSQLIYHRDFFGALM